MMEMTSVHDFLKGKTILVTGATGFLGKIFVEKILRVQPDIKKLYLLVRASNPYLATQRLNDEVFGKDLFKVLRHKCGANFGSFISEKVVAVAGDVSLEMLGVKDEKMSEEMLEDINIIVNSAATTTKVDERYDIAMATNTMGALNVLNYAKNCRKLEVLLHVSTAYVCGTAKGLITEEPFLMGQTLNASSTLDIELEKKLIEKKLSELQAQDANEETIKLAMKDLGMIRANLHGWDYTYTFTKAMGEMLAANMKDNLPLIITRPTSVISTHSEPFPGWIEKVRHIDLILDGYCKGVITSFAGHPDTVFDVIPADMVINSMMIALVARAKNLSRNLIYHIGSSLKNPFKMSDLQDVMYSYSQKNPWIGKNGKPVVVPKKLTLYSTSMDEFDQNKGSKLETIADKFYRPYTFFEGIFDDQNAEKLRVAAKNVVDERFDFDPKKINWKHYMMNVHLPAVMKYSIRSKM